MTTFFLVDKNAHTSFLQEIDQSFETAVSLNNNHFDFFTFRTEHYIVKEFEKVSPALLSLLYDLRDQFKFCIRITTDRKSF